MPFSATVYKVLIGSPSDVCNERKIIEGAIHTWNSINAIKSEVILFPVMWESDSAPLQGDRPQGILNNLIVKNCDIIVSVFWSRLGSDTGVEKSGTVEEIKYFIKEKRPALVYFSRKALPQDHDPEQWRKLGVFKKEIRTGGVQDDFEGDHDLSMKLIQHLTIVVDNIKTVPTVVTKDLKKLMKESAEASKSSSSLREEVYFKKSTDKSFVVCGVGDPDFEWGEGLHGQYVSIGNGRKAWQFSNKRLEDVARKLGVISEIRSN